MGSYAWASVSVENQAWRELTNRQMRQQALSNSVTRGQASNAVALTDAFPWLDSGVVQSLTRAGQGPDSPTAQLIAEQAALVDLEDDAFSEPAPNVPDNQFDGLWDMISTNAGRGLLNLGRGAIAALATPFEEAFERVGPSIIAAEQETEPLFRGELGDNIVADIAEVPGDVASSLSKTLQGEFWGTFWENLTTKAAPSTGALVLSDIINGRSPQLFGFDEEKGQGLLANFERRQQFRNRITIPGVTPTAEDPWANTVTVGRDLARNVTEPGSRPYEILSGLFDFGANLAPVDLGLGKVARGAGLISRADTIAAGGRVGLLPGIKKSVDLDDAVNGFLNKPIAQKMNRWFADETDFLRIWERSGKDIRVARELVDADTPEKVAQVFRNHLGTTMREVPTAGPVGQRAGLVIGGSFGEVFGPGAAIKRSMSNVRFTHEMPVRPLNPHDMNDTARTVHDFVRNAKLGDDVASKYLKRIGDLEDGDASDLYRVATDLFAETAEKLVNRGSTPLARPMTTREARALTRAWGDDIDETRKFFIDAAGQNADLVPARNIIDGQVHDLKPVAHLMSERLSNSIPLPDIQEIKRATSFYNRVWDIPGVKGSTALADFVFGTAWKSLQLITRLAYPVRVIGEEQVRLAGVGMSSAFRHPVDYMSWVVGSSGSGPVSRALKKGLGEQGSKTALDDVFTEIDEFKSAMSRGSSVVAGGQSLPGQMFTGKFVPVRKTHENYFDGAATEIGQLASDPVAQRVAGGLRKGDARSIGLDPDDANASTLDAVKEWFWSGTGQRFRKDLSEDPNWQHLRTGNADMTARQAADDYIDSVMERVNIKTGEHPDLVEAISTGKLGDARIRGGASLRQEKKFRQALEDYEDSLPEFVKVEDTVVDPSRSGQATAAWDRATDRMFHSLMSVPTNSLSRSPHFRQAYWGRMEELLGFADRPTQEAILKGARDAGLKRDRLRNMAKIVNKTEGTKLGNLEDADQIAKAFALDTTRDTLYDLTKRNQFFDSFRLVFPFGEAWKEIFTAWSKILTNNPKMLRRFQQGIQGGLGPGFGELTSEYLGTGSLPGQGFFHENQHGEMVFNYPGSELASSYLLGEGHPLNPFRGVGEEQDARVSFTGSLTGLNLFSATVLPGVGPTVQIPGAVLTEIMNVEIPEALRDTLFPFGTPPVEEGPGAALWDTFTPAWLGKWATAAQDPDNHRLLGNAWMDVARALVRSGEYNTNSPQAVDELYDAATQRARLLFILRGAAQSTAPTGPTVEWSTEDVQGNLVPTQWMVGEFHRMAQEEYGGDYERAQGEFLRRFGTENLMALQGKTREIVPRPLNEEGRQWIDSHEDLERRLAGGKENSLTIGLFAPEPKEGAFDYNAYLETIREGTRQPLSPREMVALSNQYKGRIAYEHLKSQVAGRTDAQAALWLDQAKQQLAEQYPGFGDDLPLRQPPPVDEFIEELERAVEDPDLQGMSATEGLRLYFEAREAAQRVVDENQGRLNGSKGFTRSNSTAFLRDWLRAVGEEIANEHEGFAPIWRRVFLREIGEEG